MLLSWPVLVVDLPTTDEIISSWSFEWEGGLSSLLQEKSMGIWSLNMAFRDNETSFLSLLSVTLQPTI